MRFLSGGSRAPFLVRAQRPPQIRCQTHADPTAGLRCPREGKRLFWGHEFLHPCSQMGPGNSIKLRSRARPHLWMGQPTLSHRHTGESPDPSLWAWGDRLSSRARGAHRLGPAKRTAGLSRDPAHCPSLKVTSGSGCHSSNARLWPQVLHQALQGTPGPQGQPTALLLPSGRRLVLTAS